MKTMKNFAKILLLFYVLLFSACSPFASDTKTQKSTQKIQKLSLIMTGDALLHKRVYKDAEFKDKGSKMGYSYDFSKALSRISPIISNYDLAFYNQESILGGKEIGLSTYPNFNSPQEFGEAMVELGFNLVSLANNHTLDRGERAVLNSLKFWQGKKGVLTSGSYASLKEANEVRIYEKNGIKYALLAYTYGVNGNPIPKPYLVNLIDKNKIAADIAKLRLKVDLLLVSLHWGEEYKFEPSPAQRELAAFLASKGVDIIIGSHSHYVGPIEFIDDTLVIYSLGNFISSQRGLYRRVGMLVSLDIHKNSKKIQLNNLQTRLIYTYYDENFKNFTVYPFDELNEELLPNFKAVERELKGIINTPRR